MKSLENYGVQELSLEESQEINGGIGITAGILVGIAIGAGVFGAGWAVGYYWR